jgi:flavodoxin
MDIAIVYDSSTGTTAKAAKAMGKIFGEYGHQCQVLSVSDADPENIAEADLICIGTWVRGLFIIMQHPNLASMKFIDQLENLDGKQVVIFCTYLLASGTTLSQMAKALEGKGANVVGRFKYRGPEPNKKFVSFAKSLT